MPVRTALIVAVLAFAVATNVLCAAGIVVAMSCVVAGAGGYLVARRGAATAERSGVAASADLSSVVVETIQLATELVMWQATTPQRTGLRASVTDSATPLARPPDGSVRPALSSSW